MSNADKVAIFIDCENLSLAARHGLQMGIDFIRLIDRLCGDRELVAATAYVMRPPSGDPLPYEVSLQDVGVRVCVKKKHADRARGRLLGLWDVGMAVDVLSTREEFDTAIICTGLGSLVDLVVALRKRGKRVEVVGIDGTIANSLRQEANSASTIGTYELVPLEGADNGIEKREEPEAGKWKQGYGNGDHHADGLPGRQGDLAEDGGAAGDESQRPVPRGGRRVPGSP